jgi:hypothetical protein
MKRSRPFSLILALALAAATATVTAGLALAWPDQPPDRATISGPGIDGTVEITDPKALAALKLGAMEDLNAGPIAPPRVTGDGYTITRYFDGGTFNFASLRYYPSATGQGYLYFEDGPQLQGNHTPFNGKWLAATPSGDAAMKQVLNNLGVSLNGPAQGNSLTAPAALVPAATWPWLAALLAVAAVAGGVLVARRRRLA